MFISALHIGVGLAFVYVITALVLLVAKTYGFGQRPMYAKPVGSESKGIRYAFFQGMLPWEKESVIKHLPTFIAGLIYHAGIFLSLLYVIAIIQNVNLHPVIILGFRFIVFISIIGGIALFIKRLSKPEMKIISTPDDFFANALVDLFLISSLASSMTKTFEPILYILTIILLLYIPIGKIRHCVFFFYTRILFGKLFGQRGVFPHPKRQI
jgi:hypothetical protein